LANGNGLITAGSRVRMRFAPDERLVAFVRRGDPAAFEALYERHSAELLSFCTYLLGSRQDAEDAVQSTFAAAYRALLAHERPVSLRPWLFTIARNDCLSILRKRRPWSELNGEAALHGDPVRELELREEVRATVKGMLELPERQRAALVLAEMHGLSQAEIGTVLGVRPEQVKAFVYQARSHLISARRARDADCVEIREELATARGATLLRRRLRGHMRSCAGCRAYADGVARQRHHLGALVPWAPSLLMKTRALEHALAIRAATDPSYARGAAVGGSLAGGGAVVAGGGVNGLLTKVAAGIACLGASACVGASVLGTSIFPGEGSAAPASGAPVAPRRSAAIPAGSPHAVAVASTVAARTERAFSRHARPTAASVEEAIPAVAGAQAGVQDGGSVVGADVVPGETPKEPSDQSTQVTPAEQRQQQDEARQLKGSEERQQKLVARLLKSEERRRQTAARPPRPSKEERQLGREHHEEVGVSRGPKKSREERVLAREKHRAKKTP
jgi:RNA polymerase sigma factor (sigma-70 family)